MEEPMSGNEFVTLGRSGLRVSPLALGTMTFGGTTGWGTEESLSRQIFERFIERGGTFIDTADGYADGRSEELLGKFVSEAKLREKLVIATKFTFNAQEGNPNAGGNGRKNIYRALDSSLRRLKMDYVDLYWLHAWDTITPAEEVLSTLNELVREGKIRHFGLSDVPAWYAARLQTLAEKEGKERAIALQLEYSLVERNIEREHVPAAQELGMGICPWSPLASGFLSGKYQKEGSKGRGDGRLEKLQDSANPVFRKFTDRNWRILDVLANVAKKMGKPIPQVALNWVGTQPGITSTIIGATKLAQLEDSFASLGFTIPAELRQSLTDASAIDLLHPYMFFEGVIHERVLGGTRVEKWKQGRVREAPAEKEKASAAEK